MKEIDDSVHDQTPDHSQMKRVSETNHQVYDPDAAIELINLWLADESGYDEETWPELKKALDEDRLSYRKLFPQESEPE